MDEPAMSMTPQNNYLAAEVLTASPQKLQLMLLEAAVRSAERARTLWQEGHDVGAAKSLGHAQEIVGEILAGLDREADPELVGKVAGVYLFLFRTLGDASIHHDEQKLDEAIRVLRLEQETWRQLCEKLSNSPPSGGPPAPHTGAPATFDGPNATESSGFSLEA